MNQHRSCSLCLWRDVCHGISDPRTQKKVDYNVCVCVWLLQVSWAITSTEQGQFLLRSTQASGKTLKLFFKTNVRALAVPTPSAGFCRQMCGLRLP